MSDRWEPVESEANPQASTPTEVSQQSPWFAWLLVIGLVVWQAYVAGFSGVADGATLVEFGARKPSFGFPQAPWRLAASMFLHGGWLHLICNAVLIVLWGGQICRLLGGWVFGATFLLTGLWGSLLSDIYGPEALAVGSSGGASGLVTFVLALALLAPGYKRWYGTQRSWLQSSTAVLVLNGTLAMGLTSAGAGRLDHWAHLGGAAMGFLMGVIVARNPLRRQFAWASLGSLLGLGAVIYARGSSPFG